VSFSKELITFVMASRLKLDSKPWADANNGLNFDTASVLRELVASQDAWPIAWLRHMALCRAPVDGEDFQIEPNDTNAKNEGSISWLHGLNKAGV
jgi:hypothetical protein